MNRIRSLSLRSLRARLFFGFGVMIFLAGVIGITSVMLSSRAAQATEAVLTGPVADRATAENAITEMLQARRNEKDFLLSKDIKYVTKVDSAVTAVLSDLNTLEQNRSSQKWIPVIKSAVKHATEYQQLFHHVGDLMVQRGLSEKIGLEGNLRNIVHKVEADLKDSGYDRLTVIMLMVRRHEKDYLMRKNRKKYLGAIDIRLAEFAAAVEELGVPTELRDKWSANWAQYRISINKLADVNDQIAETTEQFRVATHQVETDLDEIRAGKPEAVSNLTGMLQQARTISAGILAGVVIIGILLASLLTKSITRPLRKLVDRANRLSEGDLTGEPITVHTEDEIGILAMSMNAMQDSMRKLVSAIKISSEEVTVATTSIFESAEITANDMDYQSKQVERISAAVEQLSASIDEVAHQSVKAAEQATASGQAAYEGSQVVNSTIEGMQGINEAVSASGSSVSKLGEQSAQIGQVIGVINDIADQTNLLALNAAIEAARAGEYGRSFAVVADEVRKLADRTMGATDVVAKSISAIKHDTDIAVNLMSEGTNRVIDGVERATAAGAALGTIRESARELEDMVRSIANSADEQSATSTEISESIQEILTVCRQTSDGSKNSSIAMKDLSSKTESMLHLVAGFKL